MRRLLALLFLILSLIACPARAQRERPNIILITLDDVDHFDLYGVGRDTLTPNIDRLAEGGLRLTQFYAAAPVCSPSRAGLLTGRSPSAFGINDALADADRQGIPAEVLTLPELLDGYDTAHVGKWHVGEWREEFRPAYRYNYTSQTSGAYISGETYQTTHAANQAISYFDTLQAPFLLSVQFLAVHKPFHIPPGFDNACCDFDLDTERGQYAAMLYTADEQIGRIVDLAPDNTLIIVTSDNGGVFVDLPGRWLRGGKRTLYEGGIRVPFIAYWPGIIPAGSVNDDVISALDVLPALVDGGLPTKHAGPLVWEFKPHATYRPGDSLDYAVRKGDWKLIHHQGRMRLFNLADDPGETRDLAKETPGLMNELVRYYLVWRRDAGDLSTAAIGGVIPFEVRQDFYSGDFSAVVHFEGPGSVVRAGSWEVVADSQGVAFHAYGDEGGDVSLASGPVAFPVTVMWTATGYKSDYTHFRLYRNGVLAGEDHGSVIAATSSDGGIVASGGAEVKRLSVMALSPAEVDWRLHTIRLPVVYR